MPIFAKPKSAALNPDRLAKKKVYERDVARVRSGVPSASSKTDAETFGSLMDTLEDLKIELIKISETISLGIETYSPLSYGSSLNQILKAKKIIKKIFSTTITTTQLIKLQEITDEISTIYTDLNTNKEYFSYRFKQPPLEEEKIDEEEEIDEEEKKRREIIKKEAIKEENKIRKNLPRLSSFIKTLLSPLQELINLLNTKLISAGNDVNPKIAPEHSGINAPPEAPDASLEGSGFRTSWKLEKGASQYQNQKYV